MGVHNGVLYFPLKSFGSSFFPGREFATLMTLCLSVCFSFQWSVRVCLFVFSVFCSFGRDLTSGFGANLIDLFCCFVSSLFEFRGNVF